MKAVILAGGDLHVTTQLIEQLKTIDFVVAADSGIKHAQALQLEPDLLVGDFDSITSDDGQRYGHIPIVKHQPEKDDLDLELAIQEAQTKGATEIILLGVTGSRLDQSLAALMIAARYKEVFKCVSIYTGKQNIEMLSKDDGIQLAYRERKTFSLISLVAESVLSIKNAKYPLDHAVLKFGTGLGVSNETLLKEDLEHKEPHYVATEISIHAGLCILIVELEDV